MKDQYIKYINLRDMPEDQCGYCKVCGEKTLLECDIKREGEFLVGPAFKEMVQGILLEENVSICEDCFNDKSNIVVIRRLK